MAELPISETDTELNELRCDADFGWPEDETEEEEGLGKVVR